MKFPLRPVEQQGGKENFGSIVYETTFENYSPGIESFTLPAQAPALKEGQEYEWEVQVKCSDTNFSFIRGRIKRMLTDNAVLAAKLEEASIEDYPSILAEAGVWYDSLATVSELRRANPEESFWTEDWKEILKRIGFEDLIAVPERQLNP